MTFCESNERCNTCGGGLPFFTDGPTCDRCIKVLGYAVEQRLYLHVEEKHPYAEGHRIHPVPSDNPRKRVVHCVTCGTDIWCEMDGPGAEEKGFESPLFRFSY